MCIYELHKVDKACKSQEERQPGVKRATPGHPGGLRRSHRQAASPCAGLCALSLWAPRGIALCRAVCCLPAGSCPAGLAHLCPLQRGGDGALQELFPVMSEGKPSWSPSPGWQHEGHAGTLGNVWQWAEVFAIAAGRWYRRGLCQHIIFHSSFDLRAGRFGGTFITEQQSLVLQTHSCSCFRQS